MATSDKLIEQAGLKKRKKGNNGLTQTNATELAIFYPGSYQHETWVGNAHQQAVKIIAGCTVKLGDGIGHSYVYKCDDGTYTFSWPGDSILYSDKLVPPEVLKGIWIAKKAELAIAREKRANTVKSPTDVIRVMFREEMGLDVRYRMVSGSPRIDCDWFELSIEANDQSGDVEVLVKYKDVQSSRAHIRDDVVATLPLSDPQFTEKIQTIVWNYCHTKDILAGKVERRK